MKPALDSTLLKKDLAQALNLHIELLKDVESVEPDSFDALLFTMRSLGFMLEKAPDLLIEEQQEELLFMMFQYYNLMEELKSNLIMSYPYAVLNGVTLLSYIQQFPTTYKKEINHWWEEQTGLVVQETKQTIIIN